MGSLPQLAIFGKRNTMRKAINSMLFVFKGLKPFINHWLIFSCSINFKADCLNITVSAYCFATGVFLFKSKKKKKMDNRAKKQTVCVPAT